MTNPYRFKTKPYAHQVKALRMLLGDPCRHIGGGLPMDTGTGKTKVVIDYANIKHQLGEIERVLVIGPISCLGVWDREVLKHQPENSALEWKAINYEKLVVRHYTRKDGVEVHGDRLTPVLDWVRAGDGKVLLVLDESHEIKNPNSKQSRAVYVLSQLCSKTIWMTGTPTDGDPLELFAQMRCIDDGILGSSWAVFRKTYAVWGGYGGFQLIRHVNQQRLQSKIKPYVYPVTLDECMDIPQWRHEVVPVTLHESRDVYDKLAIEAIAEVEGMEVVTAHVFSRLVRLSQLTGGWFVNETQKKQIGHEKEKLFLDHLDVAWKNKTKKIVVFANYLDDVRTSAKAAREVGYRVLPFYGGVKPDQRERFLCKFDESDEPYVLVAQIRVGSQSVSMTAANHVCFYGHTFSLIRYMQALGRTRRVGQSRPGIYYHFIVENSIDELMWLALRTKRRVHELFLKHPELLM